MTRYIFWALLAAVCLFAFRRGGRDERIAAAVCLSASIFSLIVDSPLGARNTSIEDGILLIDIMALATFVTLALQSQRFWPLWVAGLQLSTLFAHIMKSVHYDLIPTVYAVAERFWSYPILLIILVAALRSSWRYEEIDRDRAARLAG